MASIITRIATHRSPPPAATLYVGLFAVLLAGFLLDAHKLPLAEWSLPVLAVAMNGLLVMIVTISLAALVLRWLSLGVLQGDLALSIAIGLVIVGVALDKLHYSVFKEHLGVETIQIALEGVAAGEVSVGVGSIVSVVLLFGFSLAASLGLLRALSLIHWLAPFARATERHRVVLLLGAVSWVVADAALVRSHEEPAASLRAMLPWSVLARADDVFSTFEIIDENGRVREFDPEYERRAFASGRAVMSQVLAGEVHAERSPNIVLVALESFRSDLVSPEGTPNLHRLSEQCLSAERSFTIGPDTQSGMFGLLNGLSMLQYWEFLGTGTRSIPMAVLGQLGYERTYYYSHFDLEYADMRERFFDEHFDRLFHAAGPSAAQTDADMLRRFRADLARRDHGKPHFDMLFFYATHWGYEFPAEFQKFEPVAPESLQLFNATATSPLFEHAEGLKNRYKNAALYTDSLMGQLMESLAEGGWLDDTVVIITGDHGEEFFEHGRFGHLWALNDEMTRVPLLICTPERRQTKYRFASHADVFPTLFDYMGVTPEGSRFMSGKSLLRYDPGQDHALLGIPRRRARKQMAIVGGEYKVHFRPFGVLRPSAIFDLDDEPLRQSEREFDSAAVAELMARIQPLDAEGADSERVPAP